MTVFQRHVRNFKIKLQIPQGLTKLFSFIPSPNKWQSFIFLNSEHMNSKYFCDTDRCKLKLVQTQQTPSFKKSRKDFLCALLPLIPSYFCYLAISLGEISKRTYKRARNRDDTVCFFLAALAKSFPGEDKLIAERKPGDQLWI